MGVIFNVIASPALLTYFVGVSSSPYCSFDQSPDECFHARWKFLLVGKKPKALERTSRRIGPHSAAGCEDLPILCVKPDDPVFIDIF